MPERHFIQLTLPAQSEQQDILIAVLSGQGDFTFEQRDEELIACIAGEDFDENEVADLLEPFLSGKPMQVDRIADQDWNAEWEANWQGVRVDDFCEVIPPFKTPSEGVQHLLLINPRMAFGTGHHATTRMMIRQAENLDFGGKSVLDQGCGSGILAILASKLGASEVTAIDIDPWSEENAIENAGLNGVENVRVICGDARAIPDRQFDIIFANINRSVLVEDKQTLVSHLSEGGTLLLSGFYQADLDLIRSHYEGEGLKASTLFTELEWASLAFVKEAGVS